MAKTTIENGNGCYVLRCQACDETYEVQGGQEIWVFKALLSGFEKEHLHCVKTEAKKTEFPCRGRCGAFVAVQDDYCQDCMDQHANRLHAPCQPGWEPRQRHG